MHTNIAATADLLASLDAFTRAYLECALWSTNDESDDRGGEPMDQNYTLADIEPGTIERAKLACEQFQRDNATALAWAYRTPFGRGELYHPEMAGHDLWLTRNGHGTGYWDRDLGAAGERLTRAAEALGEAYLYVGDNGEIDGHH